MLPWADIHPRAVWITRRFRKSGCYIHHGFYRQGSRFYFALLKWASMGVRHSTWAIISLNLLLLAIYLAIFQLGHQRQLWSFWNSNLAHWLIFVESQINLRVFPSRWQIRLLLHLQNQIGVQSLSCILKRIMLCYVVKPLLVPSDKVAPARLRKRSLTLGLLHMRNII